MAYTQRFNTISQFLEEVTSIEEGIQKIQSNIDNIRLLQTHILVSTSTQQEDVNGKKREAFIVETKNLLFEFKDRIKRIEFENSRLAKNDSNLIIRKQRHEHLHEKFTNVLDEYQNLQTTYMKQQKERMARQYRVVNPEAAQEEIDNYLDNPSELVFQQAVIRTTEAKDALAEVQKRHGDIKQIEQTISELAELFREMQLQVETQDPVLESVEGNVNETLIKTEKASKDLEQANESAKGARKKKWILFGIISFIIFIIIVIIIFKFSGNKSSAAPATMPPTPTLTHATPTLTGTAKSTSTLSPP